jgi:hypothetical protein
MLSKYFKILIVFVWVAQEAQAMNYQTAPQSSSTQSTNWSSHSGEDAIEKLRSMDDWQLGSLFLKEPRISKLCFAKNHFLPSGDIFTTISMPEGQTFLTLTPEIANNRFFMHVDSVAIPALTTMLIPSKEKVDDRKKLIGQYFKQNLEKCAPFYVRTMSITTKSFFEKLTFLRGVNEDKNRYCFFDNPLETTNTECSIRTLLIGPNLCNLAYKISRTENKSVAYDPGSDGKSIIENLKTNSSLASLGFDKISTQIPPADFFLPATILSLINSPGFWGESGGGEINDTISMSLLMTHRALSKSPEEYPQFSPKLKARLDRAFENGEGSQISLFGFFKQPFINRYEIKTNEPTAVAGINSFEAMDKNYPEWKEWVTQNKFVERLRDVGLTDTIQTWKNTQRPQVEAIKLGFHLIDSSLLKNLFAFQKTWNNLNAYSPDTNADRIRYMAKLQFILKDFMVDVNAEFINDQIKTWQFFSIPRIKDIKSYSQLLLDKANGISADYGNKCMLDSSPIEVPSYY